MKPGKTRGNVIERNADNIRQTTRLNLPRTASVAGGTRRKRRCGGTNHRQSLRGNAGVAGDGRDGEKRTEGEHKREDKGNQSPNPPAGYHRGGGSETKGENHHEIER